MEVHLRGETGKFAGSRIANRVYAEAQTALGIRPAERRPPPHPSAGGTGPHMRNRLGLISWATGALVLAAVTACNGTSPDPRATRPSPSPSVTSASPTPASPSEAAASEASALVQRYFATLDSVRQDQTIPMSKLTSVMTSVELTTERRLVARERSQGLRQTGNTKINQLRVQSVNLDNSDPSAGKVPTVAVDVCWDVSSADLLDKSGHSVVSSSRAERGWTRYTVANYHWSENPSGGWRVADGQDLKQTPCAAS